MTPADWGRLRDHLVHPGRRVTLLSLLSFVSGLAEALVLVLVVASSAKVVGNRVGSGAIAALPELTPAGSLVVAGVISLIVLALHWWAAVLTASMATEVQVDVQHRVIDAYLGATWPVQSGASAGRVQELIQVMAPYGAQYVLAVLGGIAALLQTVVLLGAAVVVDPLLSVIVVGSGVVLVVVLRPFTRLMSARARVHVRAHGELTGEVARTTRMAMEFRAFGVGDAVADHLRSVSSAVGEGGERIRRLGRFARNVYRDLAVLLLVVAVFVMSTVSKIDVVAFGSVVLLVVRAVNGAQSTYEATVQRRELEPYLTTIRQDLAHLEANQEPTGDRPMDGFRRIVASGIGYCYTPGDWAVRDLDLELASGEVVGIVGPSGGGKSTLVQLLSRLRRPDEGTILVDGVPYGDIDPRAWTSQVAVVPQEPDLMEASVIENIVFWRQGISRDRVDAAARAARVYDDIAQLPNGFDTKLGPGGQGLSGGQKQRVAMARALAGNPSLLVLDEPTSALDVDTEALVRDTIRSLRGRVTVVVVAHRPSTLEVCDRIVTIESGRVVADRRNDGGA